jgi:hypothetical protein
LRLAQFTLRERGLPVGHWAGESGLKLLEELPLGDLPALKGPMEEAKAALRQRIEQQRREETAESRARSGTFE